MELAKQWPHTTLEDVDEQLRNLGLPSPLTKGSDTTVTGDISDGNDEDQLAQIHTQSNAMKAELRRHTLQLEHVTARNEVLECFADEVPDAAPLYRCMDFFSKEDAASPPRDQPAPVKEDVPLEVPAPPMEDIANDPAAKRLLKKMGKRFMECETTKEDYLSQKEKIEKGLTKAAEAVKHIEEAMSQRQRRVERQMEIIETSKSLGSAPQWEEDRLVDTSIHPSILKQYKCLLVSEDDLDTTPFIQECEAALEKLSLKSAGVRETLKLKRDSHEQVFTEQRSLTSTLEEKLRANEELKRTIGFVQKECASISAAANSAKGDLQGAEREKSCAQSQCSAAKKHWADMKIAAAQELANMDARITSEIARISTFESQLDLLKSNK